MDTGLAPITYSSIHCHLSTWPRSSDRWASRTNHLFFHPLPPRPLLPSLAPITYAFIHCHRQGRSSPPTVRALAPITYAFIHCHTEAEHGLDLRDQSRTNHLCIHPLPPSAPPASRQANRPRTNHHFVHLLPHVQASPHRTLPAPRTNHHFVHLLPPASDIRQRRTSCSRTNHHFVHLLPLAKAAADRIWHVLAPITYSTIHCHWVLRAAEQLEDSSHQSPIQRSTATSWCRGRKARNHSSHQSPIQLATATPSP